MRVKIHKFPSGATIVYKHFPRGSASAIYVGFHCGTNYLENGLPHAFEHMLFQGTKNRTREQIVEDRNKVCYLNAVTSCFLMLIKYYTSNRKLDAGAEFASDLLFNSTFDQRNIKEEANVIKEERSMRCEKDRRTLTYRHFNLFCEKRYESIEDEAAKLLGTDEVLDNLKTADFVEYKNKHFTQNKFIMFASSTLPFYKIKRLCKKYFLSKISEKRKGEILAYKPHPIVAKEGINLVKNDNKSIKCIVTIKLDVPDPKVYINDFSHKIVRWNLLMKPELYFYQLREKGLIYHASAYYCNHIAKNISFNFSFETSQIENVEKIIDIIGDSISRLKTDYVSSGDISAFRYNYETEEDLPDTSSNDDDANFLFDAYEVYRENNPYYKNTKKSRRKDLYKANEKTCKDFIDKMFNKDNDIYITIMGDFDEKKVKSIKDYKKLIFKEK